MRSAGKGEEVLFRVNFVLPDKADCRGTLKIWDGTIRLSWKEAGVGEKEGKGYFLDLVGLVWTDPKWIGRTGTGLEVQLGVIDGRDLELYNLLKEMGCLLPFEARVWTSEEAPSRKEARLDTGITFRGVGVKSRGRSRNHHRAGLENHSREGEEVLQGLRAQGGPSSQVVGHLSDGPEKGILIGSDLYSKLPHTPFTPEGRGRFIPATHELLPEGWTYIHTPGKYVLLVLSMSDTILLSQVGSTFLSMVRPGSTLSRRL